MQRLDHETLSLARHMADGGASSQLIAESLNIPLEQVEIVTGRALPADLPKMSTGCHPSREVIVDFNDPHLEVAVVHGNVWPPHCELVYVIDGDGDDY